ncbi:MAG TPA: lipopolysaccharide heptosyltransferase family protein [Arcobacter sp.]|nr:lipopolysaccharide heptosyltransferase family protein [Arcobacter sp.]
MTYYLIYLCLFPFLLLASFFRKEKSNKNLIIQTAKIGDYVNTSVLFNKLKTTDIIIDKINYDFAKSDTHIDKIYLIQDFKVKRYQNAMKLFFTNYNNIYVVMPNSYNLFLGKMCFAKECITIKHYASKWYEKLLMKKIKIIYHSVEDLTIKTYLNMVDEYDMKKNWKSIPIKIPDTSMIESKKFKVGISLTAGNKIKTIDRETWRKVFKILDKFDLEIYIFGLQNEQKYLEKILKFNTRNSIISLLGKITLEELPFYISQMKLYISSDTGNSYIADTVKIPTINFAGPCFWQEQRPIYKTSMIVKSNVKETPFSSVFKASFEYSGKSLFSVNELQIKSIEDFIAQIYRDFLS